MKNAMKKIFLVTLLTLSLGSVAFAAIPALAAPLLGGLGSVQCMGDICNGGGGGNFGFFGGWGGTPLQGFEPGGGPGGNNTTPPPAPSCTLTADPATIQVGGSSTLRWTMSNFTSFALTNFTITQPSATQTVVVDCSSNGYVYQDCPLNVPIASVQSISVVQQYSYCSKKSPYGTQDCIPQEGVNYGITNGNHLWVDKGYRAQFSITYTTPGSPAPVSSGTGSGSDSVTGITVVSPAVTTNYDITLTGPGGTAQCATTVTVTPPNTGCIQILKEAYDTTGGILTPVPQFTFTLDGTAGTTQNDASGNAVFTNVTPGTHTVTEVNAGPNWTLLQSTPQNGQVVVQAGQTCAAISFKNKQLVTSPPPKVMVSATKIVCDHETDLPNWSGTSHTITATTATDYVAAHPTCHLQSGWTFEWASASITNPGDNLGAGGTGWNAFGPTNASGIATVDASAFTGGMIWVREQMQSGFLNFTGVGGSNVSPEMYCSTDVLNYDNLDKISNPTPGNTYYCVAWNVHTPPPQGQGCIAIVKKTYDTVGHLQTPTAQFTFMLDGTAGTTQNDASGNAVFTNVTPGTHTVTEVNAGPNWTPLSVVPTNGSVVVASGSNCATVTFENKQVLTTVDVCPNIAGVQTSVPSGDQLVNGQCVPITSPQGPTCTLSLVGDSTISSGGHIKLSWTSTNATTGTINNNIGAATPVAGGTTPDDIFPSDSTIYTGTFGNGTATTTCQVSVTVTHGGGGCTSNCGGGGGLDQPNVTLLQNPGNQPLAFVSLSQVPYTGFAAGPLLTLIFWLAVGLWSAGITYIILGKDGMRLVAGKFLALTPVRQSIVVDTEPEMTNVSGALLPSVMTIPMPATTMPRPEPLAATTASILPGLTDVIETRAHAAGVLLSPEAVTAAARLSPDRAEALTQFGRILDEAVRTIAREDGWVLLTSERFAQIAGSARTSAAVTPAAAEVPDIATLVAMPQPATQNLADLILVGDRDAAFALVRDAEKSGVDPLPLMTATATAFDARYRTDVGNGALHRLVEIFAHALDATYTNRYTGVKLALAQAFEVK